MNISPKQRYLDICHFKRRGDLFLRVEFFWEQALENWVKQGAPKEIIHPPFRREYFQFQPIRWLGKIRSSHREATWEAEEEEVRPKIDLGHGITVGGGRGILIPAYEPRIISEDERTVTLINATGQTVRYSRANPGNMPTFLDWPVKDRATWNEYKKRLDPDTPERYPADWNAYVQEINSESEPINMGMGSLYGYLRNWVGSERILYMFYDDPGLIEDMMDTMVPLETKIIPHVLKDIKVQQASFWGEDMAYNAGPLISPAMVRKFMMPRYKKITDLLHSYGVDVIFVDCDGNLNELIPLWLEVGINFPWPFEVAAGNDAVALRKKYGKNLILSGNIDKRALAKGKEAIREEVMSKVPFLLGQGGYFPGVDHAVPPDVTFENYCYYINLMREVAGLEKLSF